MNYRRYYVPGATVFITQVVEGRTPAFADEPNVQLLRSTVRRVQALHPFVMLGYAILPDHLHLLIRPTGRSNFSQIMHSLKPNFTKAYKRVMGITHPARFWQPRFWDHVIRNDDDFRRHLDYIHYNPVRHGLVQQPENWPHTSFREWQKRGVYAEQWGWNEPAGVASIDLE